MKLFSCKPWAALAVLFFTTMLQRSCSAGRALLLRSSFRTLPFPPLFSLNVLPIDGDLFFKNKEGSLVSSKKHKELELINANENYTI